MTALYDHYVQELGDVTAERDRLQTDRNHLMDLVILQMKAIDQLKTVDTVLPDTSERLLVALNAVSVPLRREIDLRWSLES